MADDIVFAWDSESEPVADSSGSTPRTGGGSGKDEFIVPTVAEFNAGMNSAGQIIDKGSEGIQWAMEQKAKIEKGYSDLKTLGNGPAPTSGGKKYKEGGRYVPYIGKGKQIELVYWGPDKILRGNVKVKDVPKWVPLGIGGATGLLSSRLYDFWLKTRATEAQVEQIASSSPFDGLPPGSDLKNLTIPRVRYYIANRLAIAAAKYRYEPTQYVMERKAVLAEGESLGLCIDTTRKG